MLIDVQLCLEAPGVAELAGTSERQIRCLPPPHKTLLLGAPYVPESGGAASLLQRPLTSAAVKMAHFSTVNDSRCGNYGISGETVYQYLRHTELG
jgi:hypothetical protein